MISKIVSTTCGASPSEGSSSSRRRGRAISARPIASIICSPPDRLPADSAWRSARIGNRPKQRSRSSRRSSPGVPPVGADQQVLRAPSARRRPGDLPGNGRCRRRRSVRRGGPRASASRRRSGTSIGAGQRPAAGRRWSAARSSCRRRSAPIRVTISPLGDCQRHATQHVGCAAAHMQISDLEHLRAGAGCRDRRRPPPDRSGSPRVCRRRGSGRGRAPGCAGTGS